MHAGTIWKPNNEDIFDCRLLNWYVVGVLKYCYCQYSAIGCLERFSFKMTYYTRVEWDIKHLNSTYSLISCQYLNPRLNYNNLLKFKVAAVRYIRFSKT